MYNKKLLLISLGVGLAISSFSKTAWATDNTAGNVAQPIAIPVTDFSGTGIGVNGTSFTGQQIGGNLSIPQNVINAIEASAGFTGGNSNLGTLGNSDIFGSSNPNGTGSGEGTNGGNADPSNITICLSDPCLPASENGKAITVGDLAKLLEQDLNQSLNDLAAAERGDSPGQIATGKPRRIVRRESDANANCNNVCAGERNIVRRLSDNENSTVGYNPNAVEEARKVVDTKLEQLSNFVEQVNQLKPENSSW